jgi:hypothetical protein
VEPERRISMISKNTLSLLSLVAVLAFVVPVRPIAAAEVYLGATTFYVVDDESGRVEASVPIGRWIQNITVTRDGRIAYLGTSKGVEIVDLEKRATVGVIGELPAMTVRLDEEHHRIYVLTNERREAENGTMEALPSKVLVYDTRDRGHVRTIELNRIVFDIAVVPEQDRLYCLDLLDSELKVVQLTSGAAIEVVPLGDYGFEFKGEVEGFLWRMIRRPGDGRIYIPQGGKDAGLLVVETTTNAVRRIALGHQAKFRGGVISPDGKRAFLNGVRFLSVVDLEKESEIAWRPLDVPYQGIAMGHSGRRLYLANPMYDEGGSLAVIDAGTLEPLMRVTLPDASPYTVAVSPAAR